MQFLVKAYDGDGMLEKRMEVRPRHLEGMKALGRQIICAGGLLDDEGRMNSWFVGYAGRDIDHPEIVISVVVEDYSENGITGASVARNVFDDFFN